MKTWSVQLEGTLWTDDTFNGTFEECVEYCKDNGYKIGAGARLAEIEVNEDGCATYTYQIVEEVDK